MSVDDTPAITEHRRTLRKEASTMALYVAVCLLAALVAASENASQGHVRVLGLVWGTTLGLALAHVFAFRVSARLVAAGRIEPHDAQAVGAQLLGAVIVAALATIPVVLLPATAELDAARWVLTLMISLVGYVVAHESGAGRTRSIMYGVGTFLVAAAIAVAKNILSGH